MTKKLGKITKAYIGFFDDNPASRLGLNLELSFGGGATNLFVVIEDVPKYMNQAKITDAAKFLGKPIEVEVEANLVRAWRILWEVL